MIGTILTTIAQMMPAPRVSVVLFATVLTIVFVATPAAAHGIDAKHASHHGNIATDGDMGATVDYHPVPAHHHHGHAGNCDTATCVPFFLPEGGPGVPLPPSTVASADIPGSPVGIVSPPPVRPPRLAA